MLQPGIYKADKDGWDGYELTVDIKETEKSLILKIIFCLDREFED